MANKAATDLQILTAQLRQLRRASGVDRAAISVMTPAQLLRALQALKRDASIIEQVVR